MRTIVHVTPHSHWDREWYLPFEQHRARLVKLLDDVLELLGTQDYTVYHLDGQMIAVEDYLEIRPQNRARLEEMVRRGRLQVGPWYVLQDTYLTGSESNVRNLLQGMAMARSLGGVSRIGYLPDAFGNAGQLPQLLVQAGMIAAAFGRGVSPQGAENPGDPEGHRPRHSEFFWQSPDGSRILSLYFANWYNNGMEIPADEETARAWWEEHLSGARRCAATNHLLLMNGCDHQPVQKDLPEALKLARRLYPDAEFVQSSLEDCARGVLSELTAPLEVVSGELEDQQTEGNNTLRNTASARWYLKALNRKNENLLQCRAEPMWAMASLAGASCDGDLFRHAWKLLMQNHPHDSICGCSVDEVHREMETRFEKSIALGESLLASGWEVLSGKIAARIVPQGQTGAAFAVWNTSPWAKSGVVEATVGVARFCGVQDAREAAAALKLPEYRLVRSDGREIPCRVEDLGPRFGYDLPDDRFRQPYFERQVRVTFEAREVPAFGYDTYLLAEGEPKRDTGSLASDDHTLENEWIRVRVRPDGTLDLTDKRTGRTYCGLAVFEDMGDVGDEYIFRAATGDPITTEGRDARITLIEDAPMRAAIRVEHTLELPVRADDALEQAREAMTPRPSREIGRSARTAPVKVELTVSLSRQEKQVNLTVKFHNAVQDHRLRLLFPTQIWKDVHWADSVFDLVRRPDVPGPGWTNPSRCDRMQLYAAMADETGGLGVANRGLYEYEILPERRTLAVTLLRAVGELGDWGVFPTPGAQCPGAYEMRLAILPLTGEKDVEEGYRLAHCFQTDLEASALRESDRTLPERKQFLEWSGEGLIPTCFKVAEDGRGRVFRVFNPGRTVRELKLRADHARASDILETPGERLAADEDGFVRRKVGPKEIITIRFED